jgi:hypothetical protein
MIIFLIAGILVLPAGLLGEKRNCDTLVEVEMEGGVSDWEGGSDFTPELGGEGGLGTGDV